MKKRRKELLPLTPIQHRHFRRTHSSIDVHEEAATIRQISMTTRRIPWYTITKPTSSSPMYVCTPKRTSRAIEEWIWKGLSGDFSTNRQKESAIPLHIFRSQHLANPANNTITTRIKPIYSVPAYIPYGLSLLGISITVGMVSLCWVRTGRIISAIYKSHFPQCHLQTG